MNAVLEVLFSNVLKIRPGEHRKVLGMLAYLFTAVGAFIVGRISRDTLFLELPNAKAVLPYMYMGIAIVVSGTVYIYSRIERLAPREQVTGGSLLFFAASVLSMRWLLPTSHIYYWIYYVWVELFGTLMIIQCWSFASSIFNAREAKRLFAVIGGGGVLANVVVGMLVKQAAHALGPLNLVLLAAGLILCAFALEAWLTRECRAELDAQRQQIGVKQASAAGIKLAEETSRVSSSQHLKIIATIVAMTFFVSTVVDYQFKITVGDAFATGGERAAFFGTFFSVTGVLAAVIQFGLTSRLLDRFGVLVCLGLLPVAMLGGSVWMALMPSLLGAAWIKGSENVLRYTVNDATMQLLYVPVPAAMRARAKSFIDGILKPLAIGFSGLFLLLVAKRMGTGELSYFTAAVLLLWTLLLFRLRTEYVKTLMQTLRKRRLDFADSSFKINDDGTLKVLMTALESSAVSDLLHALELLPHVDKKTKAMKDRVTALAAHESQQVRLAALGYIGQHGDYDDLQTIAGHLEDSDEEVRAHAVRALATLGRDQVIRTLEPFLKDSAARVRAAALVGLIQHGGLDGILRSAEVLKQMLTAQDAQHRQFGAWVLGEIRVRNFYQPVLELFSDPDIKVKLAAVNAAGKMGSPELIPALVYALEEPRMASAAIASLAQFGPELEPVLDKVLKNPDEALAIRQRVPKILALRGKREALISLLDQIDATEPELRFAALGAAGKLRDKHPDVPLDDARISRTLKEELRSYYELLFMRDDMALDDHDVLQRDALNLRMQRTQQRIFKLLGLVYSTKTFELVWLNLCSPMPTARANAVEILDNILEGEHKRLVVPMAEGTCTPAWLAQMADEFGLEHQPRAAWLETLCKREDPWLRVVALEALGRARSTEHAALVESLLGARDAMVRETALWAAARLLQPAQMAAVLQTARADAHHSVRQLAAAMESRQ